MLDLSADLPPRPARAEATRAETDAPAAKTPPAQLRGGRIAQSGLVAPIACADGIVLVDVSGGRRITLDAFGSRVWELLAGEPTLPVLVEGLRDDGTRAERLADDVVRLLARWREMGVITWR
jgi:hypothetical protein